MLDGAHLVVRKISKTPRIFCAGRGNNQQEAETKIFRRIREHDGRKSPARILPNRMTDEALLKRASRGDEAAFLLLYERHRDAVYRFAYRMLDSASAAEDVAHDCFLSLIKQPQNFDSTRASSTIPSMN